MGRPGREQGRPLLARGPGASHDGFEQLGGGGGLAHLEHEPAPIQVGGDRAVNISATTEAVGGAVERADRGLPPTVHHVGDPAVELEDRDLAVQPGPPQ